MRITTKDLIKILPFNEQERMQLLEEFDSMELEEKFQIEQILWRAYRNIYKLRLANNMQLAFLEAQDGREKLDNNFYKRAREKTDKEMQEEAVKNIEGMDLTAARKAMEQIIQEIRAAKSVKS